MRTAALVIALCTVTACDDGPSASIIAPLPDTTVVASVELRMTGRELSGATTKVYLDLQPYTGDLIENTLPSECDDCNFVIAFGGASIANGPHTIGVYFYDGESQIATDAISLVFAR
jgi:hypothetical protein